jgi:raffinose/stachyose/melibiose transport system substrate-binding protein
MQSPIARPSSRTLRRLAAIGALAALTGVSLSACSASSGSQSKTLTVQVQAAQVPAFKNVVKTFEKENKGVTVKLQTLSDQQKISTNGQILAGNDAPDVGIVPTNAQSYTDLIKAKALLPLTDVWKKENLQKRYGSDIASSLKSNGTAYVALFDKTFYNTIFYNKTAFQKAGITVPADRQIDSNADLYSMIAKLKTAGYQGIANGGNDGYRWGWMLDGQLFANTTKAQLQNLTTSWEAGAKQTVKYTDPAFTKSVTQIKNWYDHGVFTNGVLGQSDDQAQAEFTGGQAAMILDGAFSPASIDQAKPTFKYDWLLMPGATAGKPTIPTAYGGDNFAVPTKSKNPALAKKFIELFLSDQMQTEQAKLTGALPAVNTVDPAKIPSLGPQVQSIVAYAAQHGSGVGWTSVAPGGLAQSFFDPQMQKVLSGSQTVAQLAEAQQQQFTTFTASQK